MRTKKRQNERCGRCSYGEMLVDVDENHIFFADLTDGFRMPQLLERSSEVSGFGSSDFPTNFWFQNWYRVAGMPPKTNMEPKNDGFQ